MPNYVLFTSKCQQGISLFVTFMAIDWAQFTFISQNYIHILVLNSKHFCFSILRRTILTAGKKHQFSLQTLNKIFWNSTFKNVALLYKASNDTALHCNYFVFFYLHPVLLIISQQNERKETKSLEDRSNLTITKEKHVS